MTESDEDRTNRHEAILVVAVIVAVVMGATGLWLVAKYHADRADDLRDERATNYRICQRAVEGRAALILHIGRSDMLLPFLPLVDCRPDLVGGKARNLSHAEADAYLRRFDHHAALAP